MVAEGASFHWEPQPWGQRILDGIVERFLSRNELAGVMSERMRAETGTRFFDWIDFIAAPEEGDLAATLSASGFVERAEPGAPRCFRHPGALFPPVLLERGPTIRVGIKVESVADFASAWTVPNDHVIQGEPWSRLRRVCAAYGDNAELWAVERHGYGSFECAEPDTARSVLTLRHLECFRRRLRLWDDEDRGFARANALVDASIADLGVDLTCDLFFASEREYWQRRNRAGQVQKARQDRLGLGWANHDHHTFRSSRRNFRRLVALLEKLGFGCRERFYAGQEAGWGAQVLEQPVCGLTVFADVDLSPEEVAGNFAHETLRTREELGTVGLWCGLHGESILQAGMHHLECQFDHAALREQLSAVGIQTMAPFTDFDFLKQAFTQGERWPVDGARIDRLQEAGLITAMQAYDFRTQGAIGSHLENLERHDGYKGFNQHGVSDIISRTDPRKQPLQA
ncbi:MAG: hypothetical protein H6811_09845 [Phycisphaeraceae bacterium]|nr:hypothetical protein [Phycisphaeraceae bacterium]